MMCIPLILIDVVREYYFCVEQDHAKWLVLNIFSLLLSIFLTRKIKVDNDPITAHYLIIP